MSWRGVIGAGLAGALSWSSPATADEGERAASEERTIADLATGSVEARREAAQTVLGEDVVSEEVGAALVSAARREDDHDTYVRMLCALGSTTNAEAGPLLEQHLRSPDRAVASCARSGLSRWQHNRGQEEHVAWRGEPEVAEGFHVVSRKSPDVGIAGVAMMGVGYAAMAATSVVVLGNESGSGKGLWVAGFLPIVGPVITGAGLATRGGADGGTNRQAGGKWGFAVPVIASGVLQAAGLVMTLVAFGLSLIHI